LHKRHCCAEKIVRFEKKSICLNIFKVNEAQVFEEDRQNAEKKTDKTVRRK
jgi:hypothetical protein